mmetsp:Transcript_77848/g.166916  ORF Transcript_77848/g.166916 Transcript_77848/m.166916 type:complete len:263 (-) Transcript_77848:947-1735(-)
MVSRQGMPARPRPPPYALGLPPPSRAAHRGRTAYVMVPLAQWSVAQLVPVAPSVPVARMAHQTGGILVAPSVPAAWVAHRTGGTPSQCPQPKAGERAVRSRRQRQSTAAGRVKVSLRGRQAKPAPSHPPCRGARQCRNEGVAPAPGEEPPLSRPSLMSPGPIRSTVGRVRASSRGREARPPLHPPCTGAHQGKSGDDCLMPPAPGKQPPRTHQHLQSQPSAAATMLMAIRCSRDPGAALCRCPRHGDPEVNRRALHGPTPSH